MNIAFISYEFPPETAFGGIGTYTFHLSEALSRRGHHVEVFSCSREADQYNQELASGVIVHRVKAEKRAVFSSRIVEIFRRRHTIIRFDVIESPEYCAEGTEVRKTFPGIPMVVKLHTPLYLVNALNNQFNRVSLKKRVRQLLGLSAYIKEKDPDYLLTVSADSVCSPSKALADIIRRKWGIKQVEIVPNYLKPPAALLQLPVAQERQPVITFIGRLDVRKGVLQLADAIPLVLKQYPQAIFRFIGADSVSPGHAGSMQRFICTKLKAYIPNLEFTGYVARDAMPVWLADTGIVVLPSIWENYPCVCLEAMSAGKAIVASQLGGMAEMLRGKEGGILIDPLKPKQIAKAICTLLGNQALRYQMGIRNRQAMMAYPGRIIQLAESYYAHVITTSAQKNTVPLAG